MTTLYINNNIVSALTNDFAFNLHSPRFLYHRDPFNDPNQITFTIEALTDLEYTYYISLINDDGSIHTRYATFPTSGTVEQTVNINISDWWLRDIEDGRAYRINIEAGGLTDSNRPVIDTVTGYIMPTPSQSWYNEIGKVTFGATYQNELDSVNYMQSGYTYYEPFRDTSFTQSLPEQFTVSNRGDVAYLHYALDLTEYDWETVVNYSFTNDFFVEIFDELNEKRVTKITLSSIFRYQKYNLDYFDDTIDPAHHNLDQWNFGFVPLEISFYDAGYLREGDNYLFKSGTFQWPFDLPSTDTDIPDTFDASMYSAKIMWGGIEQPSESILLVTRSGELPIDAHMQYSNLVPGQRQSLIIKALEYNFATQFYLYNAYDPSGEIGGGDTGQQEIMYEPNLPMFTKTYQYTTQTDYFYALNTSNEDVIVQLLIVPLDGINSLNPYQNGVDDGYYYHIHDTLEYRMHTFDNYESIFRPINDVDEGLPTLLGSLGFLNPAGVLIFTFFIIMFLSILLHVMRVPMIGIMIADFGIIAAFMVYDEFYREWFIIGISLLFVAGLLTAFKGFGRGSEQYDDQ